MKKVIMVIKKLEAGVQTISVMFKQTIDPLSTRWRFFLKLFKLVLVKLILKISIFRRIIRGIRSSLEMHFELMVSEEVYLETGKIH